MPTEEQIVNALRTVPYPGFSRDIVSFGLIKGLEVSGGHVTVQLALATTDPKVPETIKRSVEETLGAVAGVKQAIVRIDIQTPPTTPAMQAEEIEGVRSILAVASGKGGVGKSTVASNLAVALEREGLKVGLCDCDIYGPSVSLMFGTSERPMADSRQQIIPIERYGIKLMSMGFLVDDSTPAILRGPLVTRYTQQFLRNVNWGTLDVLVLDLPPGTGDIQLTIVQTIALAGAVIVTTPQEVALIDARKASSMFERVNVPVLGLIENMSYFLCPSDGKRYDIFGRGGGEREAQRLGVPLLGEIPIDIPAREAGDRGRPIASADPTNPVSSAFAKIARGLKESLHPSPA